MALLKTRGATYEQNIGEYRKLRSDLQTLLQHMKNVQPLFLSFEKNYDNLQNWFNNEVGIFASQIHLILFIRERSMNEILILSQILPQFTIL